MPCALHHIMSYKIEQQDFLFSMKIMMENKIQLHFLVNRLIFVTGHLVIKNPFVIVFGASRAIQIDKGEMLETQPEK